MVKWLHTWLGRRIGVGTNPFGCQESHHQHEGAPIDLGFKEDLKPKTAMKIWRLDLQGEVKIQRKKSSVQGCYGDLEAWLTK